VIFDHLGYDPEAGNYAFRASLSDRAGGTSITLPAQQ
jgi:hypothetical protein